MKSHPTYVVTAGAAGHLIAGQRLTWCYLGMDIWAREELRLTCGPDVDVGPALTEIALRLKQPFVDWIARLGARQRSPRRWWASALASKSPLQSDLFFLVCYGEALAQWSRGGAPATVVVVEDPWLWAVARRWRLDDHNLRFSGAGEWARPCNAARRRVGAIWTACLFIAWSVRILLAARLTFRAPAQPTGRGGALIFTWIESRSFGSDGRFRDAYTGRLAEVLTTRGVHVSRLTPIVMPRPLWRAVEQSGEQFVAAPAFFSLLDVLRSMAPAFRIDEAREEANFLQRDHLPLLQRERLAECRSLAFRQHLLWYWAVRRIARAAGPRTTVVYPFENQPHEKLLCLAWREEVPDGKLVGYVMAGIPTLLLSFFIGSREADFQPLPDCIVTNGQATLDVLATHGYPVDRLVDGGAWRFEHLAAIGSSADRSHMAPRVIVALPTVASYARVLFDDLLRACAEPIIDDVTGESVQFVVTFHVDLPRAAVVRAADHVPPSVTLSDQSVGDLLATSRLCLFVAPTGSWREAVFAGVPVLRYRPDLLDIDPVDSLGGLQVAACSRRDLREAIVDALRTPQTLSADDRQRLRRRVYSPVNEGVWWSVLGLDPQHARIE